jgi:hypothetical protein
LSKYPKKMNDATIKNALTLAAVAEVATGLGCRPFRRWLGSCCLGEQFAGVAIPVARVAGIALIALGIACWLGPPLVGMLTYSAVFALYFAYLVFAGVCRTLEETDGALRSTTSGARGAKYLARIG